MSACRNVTSRNVLNFRVIVSTVGNASNTICSPILDKRMHSKKILISVIFKIAIILMINNLSKQVLPSSSNPLLKLLLMFVWLNYRANGLFAL